MIGQASWPQRQNNPIRPPIWSSVVELTPQICLTCGPSWHEWAADFRLLEPGLLFGENFPPMLERENA